MTETTRGTPCVDPETLAAFAEGRLPREQARVVMEHIGQCAECAEIAAAVASHASASRASWPARLAIAAALAGVLAASAVVWRRANPPGTPKSRLVALAPRDERPLEPRIAGLPYARFTGRMRANEGADDPRHMKLVGLAGELVETAERTRSPQAQHEAGLALLLIDRPESAVPRLRAAAEAAPGDATRWSDLAAAQYAVAEKLARPSSYPEALASCQRALDADPRHAEALFNRALVLGRLGLRREARTAWNRYLAVDPGSPWSAEARRHLSQLPDSTGELLFRRDQPRLEEAALAGDTAALEALVHRYPQRSRTFGESEVLGRWADAVLAGDAAGTQRAIAVARGIGRALAHRAGESLLRDAVHAIDEAGPARRRRIAAAHAQYRRGRIALSREQPEVAESELLQAAVRFGDHPMALLARYYAANARFDRNDPAGAQRQLESLLGELQVQPRFRALGAQIRQQLAVCAVAGSDWRTTAALANEAAAEFRQLGERYNEGVASALAASALFAIGRLEEAWTARTFAFSLLDAERSGNRLAGSLGEAARTELGAGRLYEARALLRLQHAVGRHDGNDAFLGHTLVAAAVLESRLQNDGMARALVKEAHDAARRVRDPSMRERALADVRFAEGAVALRTNPALAERNLGAALAHYTATRRWLFAPESLLLRARARVRLGRSAEAEADLARGIALVERYRNRRPGEVAGTGVLQADDALYEEAIRLRAERNDAAAVFAYAERSRARFARTSGAPPVTLRQFQSRLAGSGATVLDLIALPGEIVALTITGGDATLVRTACDTSALERLAASAAGGDAAASRELFELLIRPAVRDARQLIVIADAPLRKVPYAALFDARAGRHLVEHAPVALAASAASLELDRRNAAPSTVATLELGSGGAGALPASREEVAVVKRLYAKALEVPPSMNAIAGAAARADVLHVAGHTQRDPRSGDDLIPLAGEVMSGRAVAGARLRRPLVVVLAACETLRAARTMDIRTALSLGDGWIAAGATDVIGTLTPVGDEDARAMFGAIHRELARGTSPAAALRRMQLEAIAEQRTGARRLAWQSVALLTRTLPRTE